MPVPSTPPSNPYDRFLTPQERADAALFSPTDLTSEINLLRAMLHRYLDTLKKDSSDGVIHVDSQVMRDVLRVVAAIASTLAVHMKLNPPLSTIAEAVEEGLNLARQRLGLLTEAEAAAAGLEVIPSQAAALFPPILLSRSPP